jgi:hypothetical protein
MRGGGYWLNKLFSSQPQPLPQPKPAYIPANVILPQNATLGPNVTRQVVNLPVVTQDVPIGTQANNAIQNAYRNAPGDPRIAQYVSDINNAKSMAHMNEKPLIYAVSNLNSYMSARR